MTKGKYALIQELEAIVSVGLESQCPFLPDPNTLTSSKPCNRINLTFLRRAASYCKDFNPKKAFFASSIDLIVLSHSLRMRDFSSTFSSEK